MASPCYLNSPTGYNKAQCDAVTRTYNNGLFRADQLGVAQQDNWASCRSDESQDDDCQLVGILPQLPVGISIKNTGHDYLGRGMAPNGLTLWTYRMQDLDESDFNGQGPAIRLGAGVFAKDAYRFASEHNIALALGSSKSVGVAGGYVLGGGHGPLAPTYGLAVDDVLQMTAVTVDGEIRTANANSNADLFWALRGGGGGVYGLVTEVVFKAHPAAPMLAYRMNVTYNGHLIAGDKDRDIEEILYRAAELAPSLHDAGWASYFIIYEDYFRLEYTVPGSDLAVADKALGGFLAWLKSANTLGLPSFKVVHDSKFFPNIEEYINEVVVPHRKPLTHLQQRLLIEGRHKDYNCRLSEMKHAATAAAVSAGILLLSSLARAQSDAQAKDEGPVERHSLSVHRAAASLKPRSVPKFLFGLSQDEFVTNTGRSAQGVRSSDDLGPPERVTIDALLTSPPHLTPTPAPSTPVAGSASELPESSSSLYRELQSTSSRDATPPIEASNNILTSPLETDAARAETSKPYKDWKYATKEEAEEGQKQNERARYLKRKLARLLSFGETVHEPLELKFNAPRIRIPKGTPAEEAERLRAEARRDAMLRFKGEPGSQKRIDYNAKELKTSRLKKQAKLVESSSERAASQNRGGGRGEMLT